MRDNDFIVYNRKATFITEKGYLIGLRMRLWHFPHVKLTEFPEGYKISWVVFSLLSKTEKIIFDNHRGKPIHYHIDNQEKFFTWISLDETEKLFWQMVYQKFGYFNYE